jgi:pimeloyl-ACP methyl ester carboxylesterase/DNA-binding CsgD family transcriptional regulator
MSSKSRQTVRFLRASDGVQLGWAEAGSGPPLVKAATWLTHLEHDFESPAWHHWTNFLAGHFRYIRYDERGSGMSEWNIRDLSLDRRVQDLDTIVDAAGLSEPFTLMGMSQGAAVCIAYAIRHPDRVARMVLCGGYARGAMRRTDEEANRTYEAIIRLSSLWGSDNPAFRQVFTSRFIPGGTDEQLRWFNDLCLKTVSPELAGPLLRARAELEITALLPKVRTPTLVLHAREDAVVPIAEGRLLATEIQGAQFVELESRNHILLEHEPAWKRWLEEVRAFLPAAAGTAAAPFGSLTAREGDLVELIAHGLDNAQIAARLTLSEKTVRNHITRIFDKLGVENRSQAIVRARDAGFGKQPL